MDALNIVRQTWYGRPSILGSTSSTRQITENDSNCWNGRKNYAENPGNSSRVFVRYFRNVIAEKTKTAAIFVFNKFPANFTADTCRIARAVGSFRTEERKLGRHGGTKNARW